jgi:fructosamine-3-kinase
VTADPAVALRLEPVLGTGVSDVRSAGGQHGVGHFRVRLADGRPAFAKLADAAADGAGDGAGDTAADGGAGAAYRGAEGGFEAEARGLGWLAEARAVPVPDVLGWDAGALVLSWVPAGSPDRRAAERFGRDLARLHAAGADAFGAPWPGSIAGLPLPNAAAGSWTEWYASQRLLPYLRLARDAGSLGQRDAALVETVADRVEALAGPAEPPARIHGDCWSGNVLWSGGRGWLVDPAAHGGHRETDLAMLALFGAPFLDRIVACYQEVTPLVAGWQARVPLHQLHPLLVHVCLFGAGYRDAALDAARAALAAG